MLVKRCTNEEMENGPNFPPRYIRMAGAIRGLLSCGSVAEILSATALAVETLLGTSVYDVKFVITPDDAIASPGRHRAVGNARADIPESHVHVVDVAALCAGACVSLEFVVPRFAKLLKPSMEAELEVIALSAFSALRSIELANAARQADRTAVVLCDTVRLAVLASALSFDDVCAAIGVLASRLIETESFCLFFADTSHAGISCFTSANGDARYLVGDGPVGTCASTGHTIRLVDSIPDSTELFDREIGQAPAVTSELCVPVSSFRRSTEGSCDNASQRARIFAVLQVCRALSDSLASVLNVATVTPLPPSCFSSATTSPTGPPSRPRTQLQGRPLHKNSCRL